jgi:hypothetical protein
MLQDVGCLLVRISGSDDAANDGVRRGEPLHGTVIRTAPGRCDRWPGRFDPAIAQAIALIG